MSGLKDFYRVIQAFYRPKTKSWLCPVLKHREGILPGKSAGYYAEDKIKLALPGLFISLERRTMSPVPFEVHVIVPRVEMRFREGGKEYREEVEIIFNSITVVSSPQHPPIGQGKTPGTGNH